MNKTTNFKTGYIFKIKKKKIFCVLHKIYELDEILTFNKNNLNDLQKNMICLGQIIKFDKLNNNILFLTENGIDWT